MRETRSLRPTVIVPDTSPLIHLAAGGALHVLNGLGPVVVVDIVALEATHLPDKPFAREIADWLAEGGRPGANLPVSVVETDLGELYRLALQGLAKKPRSAGETAMLMWLGETLPSLGGPALVVYEESRIPNLIVGQGYAEEIAAATTRGVLDLAEERGLIDSAAEVWARIETATPTASPVNAITYIQPRRA